MPSWTKNLKDSVMERPRLDHKRLRVKQDEVSKSVNFIYYNNETKENEIVKAPITGALIGTALMLEAFDNSTQRTYRSNYIFNTANESTQIFSPTGQKEFDKPVGYNTAKEKLISLTGVSKVLFIYFVYDLKTKDVYAVYTNTSIAIDQYKRAKKFINAGNSITLTPLEYSDTTDISKKTREGLGKLAMRNKPKFANLELGKEIGDKEAEESGLLDVINAFNEWSGSSITADTNVETTDRSHGLADDIANKRNNNDEDIINTDDDDLPF